MILSHHLAAPQMSNSLLENPHEICITPHEHSHFRILKPCLKQHLTDGKTLLFNNPPIIKHHVWYVLTIFTIEHHI